MARITRTEPPRARETQLPGLPARELLAAASAAIPRKATISGWRTRSSRNPGTPQYPVPGTWADGSSFAGRSDKAGFRQGHLQELQSHILDSTRQHLGHWGSKQRNPEFARTVLGKLSGVNPPAAIGIPKYRQVATHSLCIPEHVENSANLPVLADFRPQRGRDRLNPQGVNIQASGVHWKVRSVHAKVHFSTTATANPSYPRAPTVGIAVALSLGSRAAISRNRCTPRTCGSVLS
jgi:hypothetical protein